MHPILLASLLLCSLLTGCTRRVVTSYSTTVSGPNTLVAGTFITSGGNWTHREGNIGQGLQVNVSSVNVTWTYSHTTYLSNGASTSGSSGTSRSIVNTGATPWFLYVEAPDRLWFFDGANNLALQEGRGSSLDETRVISGGKLQDEAIQVPADLIPRLPEELQKLIPKPKAPASRPSI